MLLKLFGLIDLAMALMIMLATMDVSVGAVYLAVMLAHAIKALIFIKDVLSLVDLAIVGYTILLPFYSSPVISVIAVIFLLFKGAYSMA